MNKQAFGNEVTSAILLGLRAEDLTLVAHNTLFLIAECVRDVTERVCVDLRTTATLWLEISGEEPSDGWSISGENPLLLGMKEAIVEKALEAGWNPADFEPFNIFYRDNPLLSREDKREIIFELGRSGCVASWELYLTRRRESAAAINLRIKETACRG